jgi:beta-lactamase superfamily II metal-dependent hydrolase
MEERMRKAVYSVVALLLLLPAIPVGIDAQRPADPPKTYIDIYFIDTEGGQATLFISPDGQSMLFDTGTRGSNGRDLNRILAALKEAKVEVLDYVVVTHYHGDHAGNAAELSAQLPIRNFIDHGPYTVELQPNRSAAFYAYLAVRDKAKARQAKAGEKIGLGGLDVHIVSSAGELITVPLPGAGASNSLCQGHVPRLQDATPENNETVGAVFRYGSFVLLDLADLTWNQERDLVCPNNLLGPINVYHTTGHGTDRSGNPVMVHAVRPRVAIMNNAAKKGGTPDTMRIVRSSPGLQDFWQLHFSELSGKDQNSPEQFIANLEAADHPGDYIKLTARPDGSFTVTNSRNGFSKNYPATTKQSGEP